MTIEEVTRNRIVVALAAKNAPTIFTEDERWALANYLAPFIVSGDEKDIGKCAECGNNPCKPRRAKKAGAKEK